MTAPERILGRYALYGEIASGGMATVHFGRLMGPVGFARTVAIKRLHPHFAKDPEFVSMFLDEARLAARIRHPNVVPTLDVVATEGELFLVMEYVQGESLSRLLARAAKINECVPPSIAGAILAGALHGLHAAHEATDENGRPLDIVHRDVSPHNILVGVDGTARVLDFGVAKAVGRLQNTREGQLKGKLPYMAPEQITGRATRATDVYACAVVLWETLALRRLFTGENEAQVMSRVLGGVTERPSAHASGISPDLDAIVMRGLAADPQARFPTARDMARALERAVAFASTSDIGEWVERLAGGAIAARAESVARIERSEPNVDSWQGVVQPVEPTTQVDGPTRRYPGDRTDLSSSAATPKEQTPNEPNTKRLFVAVTLGVAAAAVAFGIVFAFARREPPAQPVVLPAATAPSAPVPEPSALPTPPPSASAPASASKPLVTKPTSHPPAIDTCDPPYTVDKDGYKHYKKGCLK